MGELLLSAVNLGAGGRAHECAAQTNPVSRSPAAGGDVIRQGKHGDQLGMLGYSSYNRVQLDKSYIDLDLHQRFRDGAAAVDARP